MGRGFKLKTATLFFVSLSSLGNPDIFQILPD